MLNTLKKYLSYLPGWRTDRKIVVFESDDWGSIRMPSLKTFQILKKQGIDLGIGESLRYNLSDTLAVKEDLSLLFSCLSKFKDRNDRSPVFTALSVVSNPDFKKIQESDFNEYFYEPFTATLEKYGISDSFELWEEGKSKGLFVPEFHGREHLNVSVWMRALKNRDRDTMIAFMEGFWGYMNHKDHKSEIMYQAAFDIEYKSDIEYQKKILRSGLDLFEKIHGQKSRYFVPPNGPFNNILEKTAYKSGIRYIGASKIHKEPQGNGQFKYHLNWLGKQNRNGQLYITRNAFFEPNAPNNDWVNSCLKEIFLAFKFRKPAVISTHRTNYIGSLNPTNRDNSLEKLNELLMTITNKWPDVEFMTSSELGDLIKSR